MANLIMAGDIQVVVGTTPDDELEIETVEFALLFQCNSADELRKLTKEANAFTVTFDTEN
jgi:hypothetical protein